MSATLPGRGAPIVRAPRPDELPLALALLDRDLGATSLHERAREACEAAFTRRDAQHRAMVATRGAGLAGVVLFGAWAGTVGGARLYAVAGDDESRAALLAAAIASCRASGERYLLAELADEPALRPMLEALRRAGFREAAFAGRDAEHRALVAARDAGIAGVVLFGAWAGTVGGSRLYAVAGDDEAREALLAAAVAACRAAGERYLLAELADEPGLRPMLEALRRAGFAETARVADLVRDGTDLVMLSIAP